MKLPEVVGCHRPRIECQDGFSMSVQASEYHYCTPRVSGMEEYTHVEVGYPSHEEELLLPFMETYRDIPTDTVYPRVPMIVIDAVVAKHGGIIE